MEQAVSPSFVLLSQHSLHYKYEWEDLGGPMGINSPVLYAHKPGTYFCTVTNNIDQKCYSSATAVQEGTVQECVSIIITLRLCSALLRL